VSAVPPVVQGVRQPVVRAPQPAIRATTQSQPERRENAQNTHRRALLDQRATRGCSPAPDRWRRITNR
jgi:hypothetical protein